MAFMCFHTSRFEARVYALYKAEGAQATLAEAETLTSTDNHFYFVLLGELFKETGIFTSENREMLKVI
jgi:hypothetical protein